VELATASATASNPDPVVGEDCWKTDLDTAMGEGAKSLDRVAAKSLPTVVVATWKVQRLWEILPTTSWVPDYSENPIAQHYQGG
jgi:hypothetical protein